MRAADILRRHILSVMFSSWLDITASWRNPQSQNKYNFHPKLNLISIELNPPGICLIHANHKSVKTETDHPAEKKHIQVASYIRVYFYSGQTFAAQTAPHNSGLSGPAALPGPPASRSRYVLFTLQLCRLY